MNMIHVFDNSGGPAMPMPMPHEPSGMGAPALFGGATPFGTMPEPMTSPMMAPMTSPMMAPMQAGAADGSVFTLRRSGSRPLTFSGRQLGSVNGYRVGTALWHEINLYQAADGRFVGDIRTFHKAPGSKDQFQVQVSDSLDELLSFFEEYDPKADVSADFDLEDNSLAPAELMVHAANLKYRLHEAVSQYKSVLAHFLKDLHQG